MPESNAMQRAYDDIEKPSACSFSLNGIDGRTTRWPATKSLLCMASGENWLVCPIRHRNEAERDPSSIKFDTRLTANNFPRRQAQRQAVALNHCHVCPCWRVFAFDGS